MYYNLHAVLKLFNSIELLSRHEICFHSDKAFYVLSRVGGEIFIYYITWYIMWDILAENN